MIIDTSNALAAPGSSRGYACLSVACRSIAPPGCAAGGCPRRARRALRPPKCRHGVPPKALWPRGRLPPARREKGTASSRRGPWPAGPSGVGLPPPGAPPRAASGLWVLPPSGGGSGVGDGLAPRGGGGPAVVAGVGVASSGPPGRRPPSPPRPRCLPRPPCVRGPCPLPGHAPRGSRPVGAGGSRPRPSPRARPRPGDACLGGDPRDAAASARRCALSPRAVAVPRFAPRSSRREGGGGGGGRGR